MYRILMLDDNPSDVRLLRFALDKAGLQYEFRELRDGSQLFESSGSEPAPDLIVTDLHLPGLGLPEILNGIRERPALQRAVVVVLSGTSDPVLQEFIKASGAAEFLSKPLHLNGWYEIGARVHRFLTARASA